MFKTLISFALVTVRLINGFMNCQIYNRTYDSWCYYNRTYDLSDGLLSSRTCGINKITLRNFKVRTVLSQPHCTVKTVKTNKIWLYLHGYE